MKTHSKRMDDAEKKESEMGVRATSDGVKTNANPVDFANMGMSYERTKK